MPNYSEMTTEQLIEEKHHLKALIRASDKRGASRNLSEKKACSALTRQLRHVESVIKSRHHQLSLL